MKTPVQFATTALVAATCLFVAQVRADIAALQMQQLGEMSALQSQMSIVTGLGNMIAIAEGCAQIYPSLRAEANATYTRLRADTARLAPLFSELSSCLDKRSTPEESVCRSLIQRVKMPRSGADLSAFFDAPGAQSGMKMIKPCDEE